jgi:hypothetical protein
MRVFYAENKRILKTEDSLAERGEFELPVPICEQSDEAPCVVGAEPRSEQTSIH